MYRAADLLLFDDIQYYCDKEVSCDALFDLYEYLRNSGKQIVITADRPLEELHMQYDSGIRLIKHLIYGTVVSLNE